MGIFQLKAKNDERFYMQSGPKSGTVSRFTFCDKFHKCASVVSILSLIKEEIYDA